jgi:hypothetical protein
VGHPKGAERNSLFNAGQVHVLKLPNNAHQKL